MASAFFAVSVIFSRQWLQWQGWARVSIAVADEPTDVKQKIMKPESLMTDDNCNSLFYSDEILSDGRGFPTANSVDDREVNRLKQVHPEYIRLSKELYGGIVANIPTVCVDIICQREVDNKVLLFYRRDKPAKGMWWLPGGRMLKGETFFDTALRKIKVHYILNIYNYILDASFCSLNIYYF